MRSDRAQRRQVRGVYSDTSLFPEVLALAATRPIFNADLYVIDGGSGKTRAVADYNDLAHWLDQSDTTKQCALPAAHADFQGKLCLTFTAPDLKNYLSNLTGNVNWMHDGSGGEFFFVNTPTTTGNVATVVGSRNTSGRGFSLGRNASSASFWYVLTAANGFVISQTDPTNSWLQDVPTYINASYAISDTPDATVRRRGITLTSGNQAIAPESGASSQALRLGSDGSNYFRGRWRSLLFFPPLSVAQRSIVQQYIQQDTGIAA
jgi:hypothetical protein